MSSIASFSGIASGIQWRDMVDQLMQLESNRQLAPVMTQINQREAEKKDWGRYRDLLVAFGNAARKLKDGTALGSFTATAPLSPTSGRPLLSVSSSTSAQPGTYRVEVTALASAEKIRSSAVADTSAPLGYSGQVYVNGKAVNVAATDSLTSLRDKINQVSSGVTATVLSGDASTNYLVLTANETGSRGLELVDPDGIFRGLGVTTGVSVANLSSSGSATETQRFSSTSAPLATVLGVSAPPAVTTVSVNGVKITVDLANDTLIDLENRINAAAPGTASIVTETVNGQVQSRLSVQGTVGADTTAVDPVLSQQVSEYLGFQRQTFGTEISAGRDAQVTVDGVSAVRRTNTISDVVSGVTLTLQATEPGTVVDVTVGRDQAAGMSALKDFAKAYNDIAQFLKDQRTRNGALHANGAVRSMLNSVREALLQEVTGLDPANTYTRTSLAGVAFDRDGLLQVDEAKLKGSLADNFSFVEEMFRGVGTKITGVTDPITNSVDGDITTQLAVLDSSVVALTQRRTNVSALLERQRELMIQQYVRMETALARIQAQGNLMLGQLKSLSPST